MKNLIAIASTVLVVGACAHRPDTRGYADAPQAKDLSDLSAARKRAPETKPVTAERLVHARSEPDNWLTYYGAYDGQRYSALNQINRENVKRLRPAWTFQFSPIGLVATPAAFSFEAAPIVADGVMYVSGPDGYVWALDAAAGKELWRYKHAVPLDTPLCCGNVNRGVAVAGGRVFFAAPSGRLVALDAMTGKELWVMPFVDPRAGESATMAPLAVKKLVIVGSSGGEYGVRGHIDAFDQETGRRAWRRYTVPKPGEPGSESWPKEGGSWERAGGSAWLTGTYDPELNTLYWGTSNPGPDFDGTVREGDNLFTDSVLALNPDDGSIKWHYQWTPHDVWDYDGVNENILFDKDGAKLLAHFDRNGYLFILDRVNGKLVRATRYGKADWGDIDEKGRVTVKKTPTAGGTEICPGPAGDKEWPHAAYSPRTGLLYAPVIEACGVFTLHHEKFKEGLPYWAGDAQVQQGARIAGFVKAIDPATGKEAWAWKGEKPMVASVLATAGDVVFTGEPDGSFNAYDARTGKVLWQYQTGSGLHSNPVTYRVNGKQYIAVPAGWGGWMKGFAPDMLGAPRGSALFAFSLPD